MTINICKRYTLIPTHKNTIKWHDIFIYKEKDAMQRILFMLFILAVFALPGCSAIETIFKAGMWWAFFLVFLVIALVLWIAAKARKK